MLKTPAVYERDISSAKFAAISRQVSPDLLLGNCWYLPKSRGG
jgi:hypothetical protein